MAIATDREYGLFIGGEPTESASGAMVVSTGSRPINPFGL